MNTFTRFTGPNGRNDKPARNGANEKKMILSRRILIDHWNGQNIGA